MGCGNSNWTKTMLIHEIKNLDCSKKKLREFGLCVGFVLAGFALFFWWREKPFYPTVAGIAAALILLGAVFPVILKPAYQIWMTLALLMGWVMTRVLLGVLFYLAVTPIALILKVMGKDFLNLTFRDGKDSYWIKKPSLLKLSAADYEKQF